MMKYEKPIIEEEIIEIEDIVATSPGVKNSTGGWDDSDDFGGNLGDILS